MPLRGGCNQRGEQRLYVFEQLFGVRTEPRVCGERVAEECGERDVGLELARQVRLARGSEHLHALHLRADRVEQLDEHEAEREHVHLPVVVHEPLVAAGAHAALLGTHVQRSAHLLRVLRVRVRVRRLHSGVRVARRAARCAAAVLAAGPRDQSEVCHHHMRRVVTAFFREQDIRGL